MWKYRLYEHGGPEVLRWDEAPAPSPGPGEVLLRQDTIGVNYSDIQARIGGSIYATMPLPITPGVEGAGAVLAVGEGVDAFRPGDMVAYAGVFGAYAEEVVVPADRAVKLPPGMDSKLAAAVLTQGTTAHVLAYSVYPGLGSDKTVLIHAGAGGVSHLLIQMMKRLEVRVLSTVSTDEKALLAKEAGADEVINYVNEDFEAAVKRSTDNRGVHVVYDGVGKTTFEQSLNCLRPTGYMVMFGESSGPPPQILPAILGPKGSIFLTRVLSSNFNANEEQRLQRIDDVFRWVLSGELKVHIHKEYPFSEAAEAQQELESRRSAGKILLTL